jgi:hypothetical protein
MARIATCVVLAAAFAAGAALTASGAARSSAPPAQEYLLARGLGAPPGPPGGPLYWRGGNAGTGAIGLETQPAVYLVWWGRQWRRGFPIRDTDGRVFSSRALQRYVRAFFAGIGGSTWAGVLTQYCSGVRGGATDCAGDGSSFQNLPHQLQGEWTDQAPVPADPAGAIERVVRSAAARLGGDPQATYVVLVPPGAKPPSGPVWCGYHAQAAAANGAGRLQYAFIPWLNERWPGLGWSGCGMHAVNRRSDAFGHGIFDAWSIVGGHEYAEAVTEPDDFAGVRDGWDDDYSAEAADKCEWHGLRDVTLGTQRFAVQPLWSNEAYAAGGEGCVVAP